MSVVGCLLQIDSPCVACAFYYVYAAVVEFQSYYARLYFAVCDKLSENGENFHFHLTVSHHVHISVAHFDFERGKLLACVVCFVAVNPQNFPYWGRPRGIQRRNCRAEEHCGDSWTEH